MHGIDADAIQGEAGEFLGIGLRFDASNQGRDLIITTVEISPTGPRCPS